jgi:hypothetical protein
MADGAELKIDQAKLDRDMDKLVRAYLAAGTTAVATTTKRLERNLEAATQRAVPGRLWRAWASSTFPKSGPAKDPVGTVFLNGGTRTKGAMTFWTQQGEIRGKSGQYLAIPLPTAGPRGRKRDLTPGEWERAHGQKLVFIYRQGKPSLLAAIGGTTNARSGSYRRLTGGTRGRAAKGRGGANPQADAVVPIFVLLPAVKFRGALAIEPLVAAAMQELPDAYLAATANIGSV